MALYADAIPKLVAIGAKIPVSYLHEKLKLPMPEKDEEILSAPQAQPAPQEQPQTTKTKVALASALTAAITFTPEQQVIEDLGDSVLTALNSPIDPLAIASAIRAAKDPQDLEERLAVVLVNADLSEFSRVLERAMFAASVMGFAHAG